jgi:hypothetical protein
LSARATNYSRLEHDDRIVRGGRVSVVPRGEATVGREEQRLTVIDEYRRRLEGEPDPRLALTE